MEGRVKKLNNINGYQGKFVAYWMQGSQRTTFNHSLEYAILEANRLSQPLVVFFNLVDNYKEANWRHYHFMGEGLLEVRKSLKERKIDLVFLYGDMLKNISSAAKEASLLICDKGYLRWERSLRSELSQKVSCPVIEVESNLVVPVEEASGKEEYAARTIRPKITRLVDDYLYDFQREDYDFGRGVEEGTASLWKGFSVDFTTPQEMCDLLKLDRSVAPSDFFVGGQVRAEELLEEFIQDKLDSYHTGSSDPSKGNISYLSPYLHFGHISPVCIAQRVLKAKTSGNEEGVKAFLEELIVRRELAFNFVYYNYSYDTWEGMTYPWAYETLGLHSQDEREYIYTISEFERGLTHDPYWNAAMKEMTITGFMHGYMRMYWCKKILEWSSDPVSAYNTALHLNNKYFIDGRDPNSYTGIAWCFGKHDRAWSERAVYGKVRCMMASGLKRKFNMEEYLKIVEEYINGGG